MASITAKYAGKCGGCGAAVSAGSKIEWSGRITGCAACGASKSTVGARSVPVTRSIYRSRPARMGPGHGTAAPVRGYARYCTDNADCRCYDCAS